MINPAQYARWRASREAGEESVEFAGFYSQIQAVTLLNSLDREALICLGHFYPPDRIIGPPEQPSCLAGVIDGNLQSKLPKSVTLSGSKIIGNTAVLTGNLELYNPAPLTGQRLDNALTVNAAGHEGFILKISDLGGPEVHYFSRDRPRTINKHAWFLPDPEPGNYGSFIYRQLPQLISGLERGAEFDCYVVPERSPFFFQAVKVFGLPEKPVFNVREVCGDIFEAVTIAHNYDNEGFLSEGTVKAFAVAAARLRVDGPKRVYISRALSHIHRPNYRAMTNELWVEAQLEQTGFEIVYPEILTLESQISVFASAGRIIGPSGSGMFNTAFAPRGSRVVDIETFHVTVRQHAKLYASCGHRYAFVFAQTDPNDNAPHFRRRWQIDPGSLQQAVQWLNE